MFLKLESEPIAVIAFVYPTAHSFPSSNKRLFLKKSKTKRGGDIGENIIQKLPHNGRPNNPLLFQMA